MRAIVLSVLMAATSVCAAPATLKIPPGHFVTLSFHGVKPTIQAYRSKDPFAISTRRLAEFFDWMRANNWHPISVAQIEAAHNGGPALPENPVLLSFDDGLEGFYTQVYPLLKAFNYPAMQAVESGWIERVNTPVTDSGHAPEKADGNKKTNANPVLREPGKVFYDGKERGADWFLNWQQIREMQDSGLVTIATHTHDLHHGILANPQGNKEPAAIIHQYFPELERYETDKEYRQRIRKDLKKSRAVIKKHTGHAPTVVVWPYGAMNKASNEVAHNLGFKIVFGLQDRKISSIKHIATLGRFLTMNSPDPVAIEEQVGSAIHTKSKIQRAIQVDLDYIYDPDPKQVNKNLSKLLDRVKAMHIRSVYLQAFADPDGDGTASALYFPNSYLPMRADLFNRVAWQLSTRSDVHVYAWLPLLAFELPNEKENKRYRVRKFSKNDEVVISKTKVKRLSPFSPKALQIVTGIYAELAKNTPVISGILIGDDATLNKHEGAFACLDRARWPGTGKVIKNCHLSARQKTRVIIQFSHKALSGAHQYQNLSKPFVRTRNLFARVVLDPSAENRFAQALTPFLDNYDQVALMAMPFLDGTSSSPEHWLEKLTKKVAAVPGALQKVVFELQAKNWNTDSWISGKQLRGWMRQLIRAGGLNIAYYPDDFINNHPEFKPIKQGISLQSYHG